LAAFGAVLEVGKQNYALSPTYELFSNEAFATGLASWYDMMLDLSGTGPLLTFIKLVVTSLIHPTSRFLVSLPQQSIRAQGTQKILRSRKRSMPKEKT
jgi:hypothetical protein